MDKQQYEYRTGRTDPMKSSRGVIAALLILVIFLGGLVSALGIMNIHLFRRLQDAGQTPLSFAAGEAAEMVEESLSLAGMALQEPDPVYQQLYQLPEGLYVARVESGSQAEKMQIQPGDVVVALNKIPVSTLEELKNYMKGKTRHDLQVWRNGRSFFVSVSP